jgi:hypothetical protein
MKTKLFSGRLIDREINLMTNIPLLNASVHWSPGTFYSCKNPFLSRLWDEWYQGQLCRKQTLRLI